MSQPDYHDKVQASYLLGACGDALGAPLEGIRTLDALLEQHPNGLSDIIEFKNAYELGLDYPAGRVTDDTTMAMTTSAALIMTMQAPGQDFTATLRYLLWQGYLNWGQHQEDGDILRGHIDPSIQWPDNVHKFWFPCGAGRGTIAALQEGRAGSVAEPLDFDRVVKGRRVKGPNPGCGGMMRVAPIALLRNLTEREIFELSCESAAVTHGDQTAYVATGIIGLWIHWSLHDVDPTNLIALTQQFLTHYAKDPFYKQGMSQCLAVLRTTQNTARGIAPSLAQIDALPAQLGHKNPFLAAPVLAQVAYALEQCRRARDVKAAMVLSVNHSGDSDSVGAIVGNILGARYGRTCIPPEWSSTITQKDDIAVMADALVMMTMTADVAPRPRPF